MGGSPWTDDRRRRYRETRKRNLPPLLSNGHDPIVVQIHRLAEASSLSLTEISEKAGFNKSVLTEVRNGRHSGMLITTARSILNVLGWDLVAYPTSRKANSMKCPECGHTFNAVNPRHREPGRIISREEAEDIKKALWNGEVQQSIADRFGVSQGIVSRISQGYLWADVSWPDGNAGGMAGWKRREINKRRTREHGERMTAYHAREARD